MIVTRSLGRAGQNASRFDRLNEGCQIGILPDLAIFMIIQSGAAQAFVVQLESQRFDQVQLAATVGAQADNVAGVRRNFRLIEYDVKHGDSI